MQNRNAYISQKEVNFPTNATLVSKTDLKGVITYANDAFVAISGYTREELMGRSHNMVRHPDMPPQAFKWLWDTLKAGRPWRGVVKNRCKNGDHYWVQATVVPLMEAGKIVGYMSVRRKPSRDLVAEAEGLYRELNQSGAEIGSKYERWKFKNWPLHTKMQVLIQGSLAVMLCLGQLYIRAHFEEHDALLAEQLIYGQIGLHILLFFGIGMFVKMLIVRPLEIVERSFTRIMQGELDSDLDISILDEMGGLLCKTQTMESYLRTMVDEITQSSRHMKDFIGQVDGKVGVVTGNVIKEQDHIQAIAATMEEYSQSVAEVANMAADSMADVQAMQKTVEENNRNMELSIAATSKVADTVQSSSKTISDLGASIQKIGTIANAIKEIADQTNLLALNAAIEAARAGEQGRGFAVVADEVRKLAERTATSTKDIANTIGEINAISVTAVKSMQGAVAEVGNGIELIRKNGEGLKEIMAATVSVSGRVEHIALASREQSEAGHGVAISLENVTVLVDSNAASARETKVATLELAKSADELKKAGYPLTKCAIE
ncbi:MAG: methyl-accepting chemotaxis protein [Nitrosomonadales bacterium]|nr:methyl-accepting chemotaxis protein [Nitrosomonadales bacterium]